MSSSERSFALEAGRILSGEHAQRVRVIGVSEVCGWADYLVLATAQSHRQLQGLMAALEELMALGQKTRLNKRPTLETDWALIDLGDTVVHLFTPKARDFYDLDRLFHNGELLFEAE